MAKLSVADRHHLEAAQGWLDLGNWAEANEELEKITPLLRAHHEVLFMRAQVYAAAQKWTVVLELLDKVTDLLPKRVEPWLLWARAYEELGDADMALETLSSVVEEFHQHAEVHYQMAAPYGPLFPNSGHYDVQKKGCAGGSHLRV